MNKLTKAQVIIRDGFNAISNIELNVPTAQKSLKFALKMQEFIQLLWNKKIDMLLFRYSNSVSDYNNQISNELYYLTEEEYRFITTMILQCCLQ